MAVPEKHTVQKVSKYGVFSGPYFPAFGMNTEIYSVNWRKSLYSVGIQKNMHQEKLLFGNFSRVTYFVASPLYQWQNCPIDAQFCQGILYVEFLGFVIF